MKRSLRDGLEEKRAGRSPSDRGALFVGILNAHLPAGTRAVLVGGALVELYTTGAYVNGRRVHDCRQGESAAARLLAAKFWRSPTDWESILLFSAQRTRIDLRLRRTKAASNDVLDKVEELVQTMDSSKPNRTRR